MHSVARRLERNIKDVLDQIGDDKQRLLQLLTGKRVILAEELSKSVSLTDKLYFLYSLDTLQDVSSLLDNTRPLNIASVFHFI